MRRILSITLITLVITGFSVTTPPAATADVDGCTGLGTMFLQNGYSYAPVNPKTTSFTIVLAPVFCLAKGGLSMAGTMSGNCGFAAGAGMTQNGHDFLVLWVGDELTFRGGVKGTLTVSADATHSGSCLSGTATRFTVAGTLIKDHVVASEG